MVVLGWLVLILAAALLVGVTVWFLRWQRGSHRPLDETDLRTIVVLHNVRRKLEVAGLRSAARRDADRLRHELDGALADVERRGVR